VWQFEYGFYPLEAAAGSGAILPNGGSFQLAFRYFSNISLQTDLFYQLINTVLMRKLW